jgi:hypothetical protein
MSRIRWIEECRGRWSAMLLGHALEVFRTGLGDFAWQVYNPLAADPTLSIAAGDAPTFADAKWWAERAARSATLLAIHKALGPEEFDRKLRAELDALEAQR